jgi:hypothetical protein
MENILKNICGFYDDEKGMERVWVGSRVYLV